MTARITGVFSFGRFPTPVERVAAFSSPDCSLWVKRDDLTHDVYGGNKVRKLEHVLAAARAVGARRLVTLGAAGSHHVLATTYFGARAGFQVEAVIVPQPRSDHAVEVLRASLALGLIAFPVRSWAAAPIALAARAARGARFVGLGGSSVAGSMGYVAAARELASQVRNGVMPEPDVCVVALGSGGTAAGLSAGFAAEGMKTRVIGVCVATPILVVRSVALTLAWACARRVGVRAPLASMRARMEVDARFLGRGYGYSTAEAERAMDAARDGAGLTLDPTYTAKTFAAALAHARAGRHRVVLYWHTLSSAPMRPLLSGAPSEGDLAPSLRALWAAP